jgi:putative RNA 2'-phosphotransferase
MNRQYVHLSTTIYMAKEVGKRKNPNPIILTILAKEAFENGVVFYKGNDFVWLVDRLPKKFIDIQSIEY